MFSLIQSRDRFPGGEPLVLYCLTSQATMTLHPTICNVHDH